MTTGRHMYVHSICIGEGGAVELLLVPEMFRDILTFSPTLMEAFFQKATSEFICAEENWDAYWWCIDTCQA